MKKRKVGEVINMHIGKDNLGQFWWAIGEPNNPEQIGGPFATEEQAEANFQAKVLPGATIKDGGSWDPNWNKKQ